MSRGPHSLPALEAAIWRELKRASVEREHEWRLAVLATVDGESADARSVVLREVDVRGRQLTFFSDARARKVAQLMRHPRATLVMWSPRLGWQLRCRVLLSLDTAALAAQSRWARIRLTSAAQDYLAPQAPGDMLAQPADHDEARSTPQAVPAEPTFFAVINAHVASLDWLELHADGHRRAHFESEDARWLQP